MIQTNDTSYLDNGAIIPLGPDDQWQEPDADRILAYCKRSLQDSRSITANDLRTIEGLQRDQIEQFESVPL